MQRFHRALTSEAADDVQQVRSVRSAEYIRCHPMSGTQSYENAFFTLQSYLSISHRYHSHTTLMIALSIDIS